MKSNEIKLTNSLSCAVEAIQEIERACREAGLEGEQVNRMRLLTEEAIAMTTDILTSCRGTLWMEWEGGECQLHLTAVAPMDETEKAAFLEASRARANAPVKGLRNRISALLSGLLSSGEYPQLYQSMQGGFVGSYAGAALTGMPVWSLSAYAKSRTEQERESDGLERSILTGLADDVVVSVKNNWVELVVRKRFDPPAKAALPRFTGLSHVCIFVDDLQQGVAYYRRLLGAIPDHYLPHWRNRGFFQAAGFLEEAGQGEVSIAFLNVPGARLTLELMEYHHPQGRKEPVFFAANDVSGARHVALKVTNIEQAFLHVKAMPDTRLINDSGRYRVFQISPTTPEEVRFFDQDLRETDQRNVDTAEILSQVRYFYFLDKYGLQWEFEQGHTDIGD